MVYRLLVALTAIAIVAGVATTSFAEGEFLNVVAGSDGLNAGPLSLHLGVQVKETQNSNIYSTPDNEIEDYIIRYSPAALLRVKTQRHKLEIGGTTDTAEYSDYTQENFTAMTFMGAYSLESPAGIEFSLSGRNQTSEDPRPEQNAPERKEHFTNDIESRLVYIFPSKQFSVEVFGSQFQLEYDDTADNNLNRMDIEYGLGMYYKLLPKTALLIEYSVGDKEYYDRTDSEYDSSSNFYRMGIRWDATAKMNGELKFGYEDRTYDAIDHSVSRAPVVVANVRYKITESTKIKFLSNLKINETTYTGNATESLSSSYNYDHQDVGFGLVSRLAKRFVFDLTASIGIDEYENYQGGVLGTRKDTIHNLDVSIDYDFNKNFTAGVAYKAKSKESNDPNQEEETQLVSAHIRLVI